MLTNQTNLANLKTEVDKLDIDGQVSVPADLSKLSNAVKNDVVKKTIYDKLVAKVNNIDTSAFVLKTKYNTDKTELENKIPDTSGLAEKTDYNTKITETEGKIPSISGQLQMLHQLQLKIKYLILPVQLKKNRLYHKN